MAESDDYDSDYDAYYDTGEEELFTDEKQDSESLQQALLQLLTAKEDGKNATDTQQELHVERITCLLKYGSLSLDDVVNAFHLCMRLGHLEVIKAFITRGVDPTIPDQHGNTAIHLAFLNGCNSQVVEYLLGFIDGEGINDFNKDGETPLIIAVNKFFQCERVTFCGETEDLMNSILCLLESKGIDVNLLNNNGCCTIVTMFEEICFCHVRYLDKLHQICQKLIAAGADVNAGNNRGKRPIHMVFEDLTTNEGFSKFRDLLLNDANCDVNVSCIIGDRLVTPLLQLYNSMKKTVRETDLLLMEKLLAKGADPTHLFRMLDKRGGNILHMITSPDSLPLNCTCLIKLLDDPEKLNPTILNSGDVRGYTPFCHLYSKMKITIKKELNGNPGGVSKQGRQNMSAEFNVVQQFLVCGLQLTPLVVSFMEFLLPKQTTECPLRTIIMRYVLLFLQAGLKLNALKLKTKSALLKYAVLYSKMTNNYKILEAVLTDFGLRMFGDLYSKLEDSVQVTLQSICSSTNREPMSLQRQCAGVIRNNLHPNAVYGVNRLQCRADSEVMKIPRCIKDIILAQHLNKEQHRYKCRCMSCRKK